MQRRTNIVILQRVVVLAAVNALGTGRNVLAQSWSVQDLRDAVAAGGHVSVPAGRYVLDAPLFIDQPVNLTMDPGAMLVADWGAAARPPVVHLLPGADGSEIYNLNIDGQGNQVRGVQLGTWVQVAPGESEPVGVHNVTLQDVSIANVGDGGIQVLASEHATLRNLQFNGTALHHVGNRSPALLLRDGSDHALIEGVAVRNAGGKGIGINGSDDVVLRHAVVYDTHWDAGDGIHTTGSNHLLIDNARVFDPQGNALKISRHARNVTVTNSAFNKNDRGGVGRAFHLQGGKDSDVSGSIFLSQLNRTAIRVADHPNPTLSTAEDNYLHDNHIVRRNGGYLTDSGTNTIYEDNAEDRRPLISWMSDFGLVGMPMHNLTTGEVHFDGGGFDLGCVGDAPGQFNTLFGTWSNVSNDVVVVDGQAAGFEAFDGRQFVRLRGGGGGVDRPRLGSPSIDSGSVGDLTRSRFAFRVDEGVLRVRLRGAEGSFADILFHDDGTIEGHDGTSRLTLAMSHQVGQWNTATVEYILGETESFLSINNAPYEAVGARAVTSTLRGIDFRNEGDAPLLAYIDAVPEPAAVCILAIGGGILLLGRRRRAQQLAGWPLAA